MKKLLASIAFVFATFAAADAQSLVRGRIVEQGTGVPEPGAVVMAGKAEGAAIAYASSDTSGVFSLSLPAGDYQLSVSSMGRKDYTAPISVPADGLELGDIALETDAAMLKGASVTDLRALVKLDADKLTYDVSGDADAKANTLLDMLRKVPMVTVDAQDNITVNGSSDFKVYVDGKPDQMLSSNPSKTLKNVPASSIKNIEVITNPGAKYDAEGTGGVLNLITDRSQGGKSALPNGVSGTVSSGIDTRGSLNGGLNFSARYNKFTFGGNFYGGRQRNPNVIQTASRGDDAGNSLSQRMDVDIINPYLWGNANMSYEPDTLNLITAQFGTETFGNKNEMDGSVTGYVGDLVDYYYGVEESNRWRAAGYNAGIDWQRTSARNKDRYFILSYRYSTDPSINKMRLDYKDFEGNVAALPSSFSKSDQRSQEHTVQSDFTTPLKGGHELNFGLKYILRLNHADGKYYLDDVYNEDGSSLYRHYNNIAAAYAEYKAVFGKFVGKAGFRYEYTWQRVAYPGHEEKNFKSEFGSPVPNLSFQYNISPMQNLALTWSLRIRRPGIYVLNPYVERTPVTLQYGNSDVEPANTHKIEFKYNFFNPKFVVSSWANWQFCNDGINQYTFYDADHMLNTTYGNILHQNNFYGGAYVNWNVSNKTRVYASLNGGHVSLSADKLNLSNDGWTGSAYIGYQQTLPWDLRFTSGLYIADKHIELQGYGRHDGFFNLGVSKSFLEDKLTVSISGMTNTGKGRASFKETTKGEGFTETTDMKLALRAVRFEISWTFGKSGISVKQAKKSVSNDDLEAGSRGGSIGGASQTGAGGQ